MDMAVRMVSVDMGAIEQRTDLRWFMTERRVFVTKPPQICSVNRSENKKYVGEGGSFGNQNGEGSIWYQRQGESIRKRIKRWQHI